ncbi:hypothetical protein DERP_004113 [Dermatophagoides pteronyssinus]|uniref:Uncharacterized protein n=1 Tax=Dermatophagoides pteronyssinus TaxID=6956 RepID=A0ABQ8J8A2_DERPT|nr:hypothetical protein DERP_004113 [Dermatophagoides pteronyssinus]
MNSFSNDDDDNYVNRLSTTKKISGITASFRKQQQQQNEKLDDLERYFSFYQQLNKQTNYSTSDNCI